MQDSQQTFKLDRFEIYKATIGDFVFEDVEDKLHSPIPMSYTILQRFVLLFTSRSGLKIL